MNEYLTPVFVENVVGQDSFNELIEKGLADMDSEISYAVGYEMMTIREYVEMLFREYFNWYIDEHLYFETSFIDYAWKCWNDELHDGIKFLTELKV